MIIDAFTFFDELDLLEIRLNILNNKVDKFVLVESTQTFSGNSKPLYYQNNRHRFAAWEHKIIHHVVDEYPSDKIIYNYALNSINTGNKEHWWVREFYQKESLLKPLVKFDDSDLVFVSDLDEIWNPKIDLSVDEGKIYRPLQNAYHYYINNRTNQDKSAWTGTRFGTLGTLKKYGPNHFRTEFYAKSIPIQNGGWHFTFLGGWEEKVKKYDHPVYAKRHLKKFDSWIEEKNLPDYLIQNRSRWEHYFYDAPNNYCEEKFNPINRLFKRIVKFVFDH